MSKKLLIVIIALLLVVCGVSTYIHIKNKNESEENKKIYERGCRKSKDFRQPLALNELLNVKLATKRSKPEGGVFHPLFA